jgi:AraC-like DNA-binding protein
LFPLSDGITVYPAGVAVYPPGAAYGPRNTLTWEFVWLIEGDAEYSWGDTKVAALEGSIILCRPGAADFFQWDRHRLTRHAFFHFNIARPPDGWQNWPLVREPEEGDILQTMFRHVLTWKEGGDPRQEQMTVEYMLTAFRTGQRATGDVARPSWPPAVEAACAHIFRRLEANPTSSPDLRELAEVACVTPEHLCRLFKSSLGYSPVQTVRLARLERAAVLLVRSNYTVQQVADLCGFSSPYHFSRAFKARFGLPPSSLRQRTEALGHAPPNLVVNTVLAPFRRA